MAEMRLLQCGFSKSGNYLTYKLLSSLLRQSDLYRRHMASSGLGSVVAQLCADTMAMPEQCEIDNIDVRDGQWLLHMPHPVCRRVPVEPELLLRSSSLLWTHETPDVMSAFEKDFTHRIYILRDGRDALNSYLHYMVSPAILRLYVGHRFETLADVMADLEFFETRVERWVEHTKSYLRHADSYFLLRFEDLVENRRGTIERLAEYLGLFVDVEAAEQAISFESMRKAAPSHVRRGRRSDWREHFSVDHRAIFGRLAGEQLAALGYEV